MVTISPALSWRVPAAGGVAGLAMVGWIVLMWTRPTILVTPVDGTFLTCWRVMGVLVGLWTVSVRARWVRDHSLNDPRYRHWRRDVALFAFIALVFGAMIGGDVGYAVADWRLFRDSDTAVAWADFPIRSVNDGKGGPSVDIGSAGEVRQPAISRDERRLLGDQPRLTRPWQWCLPLRRQATYAAVRIWLPRRPRLSDHRIRIVPCPEVVRWID